MILPKYVECGNSEIAAWFNLTISHGQTQYGLYCVLLEFKHMPVWEVKVAGEWSANERAAFDLTDQSEGRDTHPVWSWGCWRACRGRTAWCRPGSGGRWWGCTADPAPVVGRDWRDRGTGDPRGRHPTVISEVSLSEGSLWWPIMDKCKLMTFSD